MTKLNTINLDTWAIIKIRCMDGVERVGMIQEFLGEHNEKRVIERGLHEEMAIAMLPYHAKRLNYERFDNNEHEAIEY